MNGREFFDLAVTLANGSLASERRSCVSRAYYGAFHVAHDYVYLMCRVNLPVDASSHKKLHQLFESTHIPLLMSIGRNLSSLREARNKADYKLSLMASETAKNAKHFLDIASDVVNDVEKQLVPAADAHLQDAIRAKAAAVFRLVLRP